MNYIYNKYRHNKKNLFNYKYLFITFSFIIIAFLIFSIFFIAKKNITSVSNNKKEKNEYRKLFDEKNYLELIKKMDVALKKEPFNKQYLVYRGYSYFLSAEEEHDLNKKNNLLYSALFDLRKAMAVGIPNENLANVFFALGKIYYYLGKPYYFQSQKYLNQSLLAGNKRIDLLYVLGILYSHIGDYEKSITIFTEALSKSESDLLVLALADSYIKNDNYSDALEYLRKLINKSTDPKIIEKSNYLIGEIYFKENKLNDALSYFDKVVELNENNALAYFYRGEIFYKNNNLIKARSEWRKTLQIDPSHIKANKRLYL